MTDTQTFKRLFIAIKITPDMQFYEDFDELREEFAKDSIRWVGNNDLHLTLHFFGDTAIEKIPLITDIVKKAVENITPFYLQTGGCGYFGNKKNPRVIFTEIEKHPTLTALHKKLQHLLTENNFQVDLQEFIPHITLGRIRQVKDFENFSDILADFQKSFQWQQAIHELILFESHLTQHGANYNMVEKFDF